MTWKDGWQPRPHEHGVNCQCSIADIAYRPSVVRVCRSMNPRQAAEDLAKGQWPSIDDILAHLSRKETP